MGKDVERIAVSGPDTGRSRVFLLSFGTTDWTQSRAEMARDIELFCTEHGVFSRAELLSEHDLGDDYNSRFSPFFGDHAYAYWTWKPYCIMRALKTLRSGEFLLYLDCRCGLPRDSVEDFRRDLYQAVNDFAESGCTVGLTRYIYAGSDYPNRLTTTKAILRKFGLERSVEFCDRYPHYQSGLILLQNSPDAVELIRKWYDFMDTNYEECITGPFMNCPGQCAGFNRNGADQAVLQCLMYTQGTRVFSIDGVMRRYHVAHKRNRC